MYKLPKNHRSWSLTLCSAILCSSLAQAEDDVAIKEVPDFKADNDGAIASLTGFNINETAPLKKSGHYCRWLGFIRCCRQSRQP